MAKGFSRISKEEILLLAPNELKNLKKLLDSKKELEERDDILPFLKENPNLFALLGFILPFFEERNEILIAFEYDLWGDYKVDMVVGYSAKVRGNKDCGKYYFIEFEDAKENSIFKKDNKTKPDFASRFEHGVSQIIDWYYTFDNVSHSFIKERFDDNKIKIYSYLIIGRSEFLKGQHERIDWRNERMLVNSKPIPCMTYDELYVLLEQKIDSFTKLNNSKIRFI